MRTTSIIRQSIFIKVAFAVLVLLLTVLFAISWIVYGNHPVDKKSIGEFAEITVPFGKYTEIYVVDGKREIFLVKEKMGDSLELVDGSGQIIADLAPMTEFVRQNGPLLVLMKNYEDLSLSFENQRWDTYAVVNYESLLRGMPYEPQHYSYFEVHSSGKYYAGRAGDNRIWEIRSADGKLLLQRDGNWIIQLYTAEGLVSFSQLEGTKARCEVTDVFTGETVYEGESDIVDTNGHLWICDSNNPLRSKQRYVVDAEFRRLDEEITGENLCFSPDGKYLFGQLCVDSEDGGTVKAQNFVADEQGNIIYREEPRTYFSHGVTGDTELVEINGDLLLRRNYLQGEQVTHDCIMLEDEPEALFEGHPGYCAMDFDDGAALCIKRNDEEISRMNFTSRIFTRVYQLKERTWVNWYDWYYVNEEGEAWDFAFECALPTIDGYAAVMSEKKWGVIRFKN